ncbi:MAG TPA: outer membrane beta-barrel protein [Polyangiaceae bacterium]|jgi:hypothetical protein
MARRFLPLSVFTFAALPLSLAATARAQYYAAEPPPLGAPWYEALEFSAFADAYASVNYNFPKPQDDANGFRAYDTDNGFALAWVGLDVGYEPDPVGGTLSLRFGPTAETIGASCLSADTACDGERGLDVVKQAFVSFQPFGAGSRLTLDFGKFDTIYGAEVAESQHNFNYTRGLLYWLGQPLFHTGLRLGFEIVPELSATALVVNGYNNSVDNNVGKSFGLQLAYAPSDRYALYFGWLGGPEQDDTALVECGAGTSYSAEQGACVPDAAAPDAALYRIDRGGANELEAFRHLLDLVVVYSPIDVLGLQLNADYGTEGVRGASGVEHQSFYGVMLAARLELTDVWAVAGRGEYYADPDGRTTGFSDTSLASGTLTLEALPTENLVLRLEQRADFVIDSEAERDGAATTELFGKDLRDGASQQHTTTLGVVVRTN